MLRDTHSAILIIGTGDTETLSRIIGDMVIAHEIALQRC